MIIGYSKRHIDRQYDSRPNASYFGLQQNLLLETATLVHGQQIGPARRLRWRHQEEAGRQQIRELKSKGSIILHPNIQQEKTTIPSLLPVMLLKSMAILRYYHHTIEERERKKDLLHRHQGASSLITVLGGANLQSKKKEIDAEAV